MADKERIGLFGGTFNPIHSGHLRAAEIVQETFSLSQVLFIPSYIPPHKVTQEIASPQDRLMMVELALAGNARFKPCAIEVEAREKSYSILTLEKIKRIYRGSSIFFILGVDSFLEIETWREYERVLSQCSFVVISRPGYELDRARDILGGKYQKEMYLVPSDKPLEERLLQTFKILLLRIDALDVSSTEVRRRIKNGDSLEGFIPREVEAYIKEKGLYR